MDNRDNYETAKINARPVFLKKEQTRMIEKFGLEHDASYLYVTFLGKSYRVGRRDAAVERLDDKLWRDCGYDEVLSIYDLLGHSDDTPHLANEWCAVNSLPGVAQTNGLGNSFFDRYTRMFAENEDAFIAACRRVGGVPAAYGDAGFRFDIFNGLPLLMRLYRADEEFDAQINFLWDRNTLSFIYYETTYYVAGTLFERIARQLGNMNIRVEDEHAEKV